MAARAFWTLCRPGKGKVKSASQSGVLRERCSRPRSHLHGLVARKSAFSENPKCQNTSGKALGKLSHARVVFVQYTAPLARTGGGEIIDQLAFGQRDRIDRIEKLQVRGATLVTTPTCGSASRARRAISPAADIASSITATSCSGSSASSAKGSPKSLFKLPGERSTRKRRLRMAAIISFVVLFPVLPVTAKSRLPHLRRTLRPSVCNARACHQPQSAPAAIPPSERWRKKLPPPPRRRRRVPAPVPQTGARQNAVREWRRKAGQARASANRWSIPQRRRSGTPEDVSKSIRNLPHRQVSFVDCRLSIFDVRLSIEGVNATGVLWSRSNEVRTIWTPYLGPHSGHGQSAG
jgi:hypothetical protein